jgi:hypothetical protein
METGPHDPLRRVLDRPPPLDPGIYHYAFRTAGGEWFVPESTPGRRDDGFDGFVAILVVPQR